MECILHTLCIATVYQAEYEGEGLVSIAAVSGSHRKPEKAKLKVLLVEDEPTLRSALVRDLALSYEEVVGTSSAEEALELLDQSSFDVLVTDLRLKQLDGIQLLQALKTRAPKTATVLISGCASAQDYEKAMAEGAFRVLCKPLDPAELCNAISAASEQRSGFRGNIHGVSLVDILQIFHHSRRTVSLRVAGGAIYFRDGEIIHAEIAGLIGEPALNRILGLPSGDLESAAFVPTPTTVTRSFQSLLLDALRLLDEEQQKGEGEEGESAANEGFSLPPDTFLFSEPAPGPLVNQEQVTMGKIDDACKTVVENVDGAVACGVVDLDTGMLLGIFNQSSYTSTLNEVVAAATMDIFRGANVGRIEKMVREHRGLPENGEHYFEEIHVTSRNNFHFAKTLKGGKAVVMLVTKKSTNIGMGWAQLKSAIPEVEPHVP